MSPGGPEFEWCLMSFVVPRRAAPRLRRPLSRLLAATAALVLLNSSGSVSASAAESRVLGLGANYAISFNGFHIGDMRLDMHASGAAYEASSDVEISALLGAIRWKGRTKVSGTIAAGTLRPSDYAFDFEGSSRSGMVRMGFKKGDVIELTSYPPVADPPDFVPLLPQHFKSVLDPLSAIVALARPERGQPCGRKLEIFDGSQRLDVKLVARRVEKVRGGQGTAFNGVVCGIQYTPVGGYRDNAETRSFAQSDGIEVAFRPIRGGTAYVPYRMTLPTIAGSVTIEATGIDVTASGRAEVALVD